jgi:hypothetical protein
MTANSPPNDHLPDPELERLRQEWVDAHHAWTQVVGNAAASSDLTDEQRAALARYHAAETAYFSHHRMRTPDS